MVSPANRRQNTPMIHTVTGNLLAERTLTFAAWTPGRTQRARAESFQVGGKGVNVSKMLARMGSKTTAWCFVGGAAGQECEEWLRSRAFPVRAFSTLSPTRTGLVVRAPGVAETTFLAPDRAADESALNRCAAELEPTITSADAIALCGSFPGFDSPAAVTLRSVLARAAEAGRLVVDSYGPPLAWAVRQPTRLIKINRDEFDGLFEENERGRPVLDRIATALARWPVRSWIISDGPREVCYGAVDTAPGRQIPPAVEEVSATGSGDVLLACVLHAQHKLKLGLAEALSFALPYAAANAAHPGVAEFDLNLLPSRRSVHP